MEAPFGVVILSAGAPVGVFPPPHLSYHVIRPQENEIMRISRSHGDDIEDPTDRDIDEVLEDIEDDNGSFAILSDGDDFIQAAGQLPDQLTVEYQEDGAHHRCMSHSLTLDEVKEMFKQYRKGSTDWKRECEWEEVEIGGGFGCAGAVLSLVLFMATVATMAA